MSSSFIIVLLAGMSSLLPGSKTKQAQAGPKTEPAPAGEAPKETETLSSNKMDPFSVGQAASTDSDNKKDEAMKSSWSAHNIGGPFKRIIGDIKAKAAARAEAKKAKKAAKKAAKARLAQEKIQKETATSENETATSGKTAAAPAGAPATTSDSKAEQSTSIWATMKATFSLPTFKVPKFSMPFCKNTKTASREATSNTTGAASTMTIDTASTPSQAGSPRTSCAGVDTTTTITINDAVNSASPAAGINVDAVSIDNNPAAAADSTTRPSEGGDSATTRRSIVDRGLHKMAKRLATMLSKMDTKAGDAKVVLSGTVKSINRFRVHISVRAS